MVILLVNLVEDKDEGKLSLVHDTASVKHVGHEGGRGHASRRINDVRHYRRHQSSNRFSNDLSGGGPGEDFNLTGSVDDDVLGALGGTLLDQFKDFVKFGGK